MKLNIPAWSMLLLTLAGAPTIDAQSTALGAARVTLIAGNAPSPSGRTEVVRQASRHPQNVIVVERNANADDLAAAIAMMNGLRATFGDHLSDDYRASPERVKHGARSQGSDYRRWLQDQLARLRTAPERTVQPFGLVRTIQVTLPPPAGSVTKTSGQ